MRPAALLLAAISVPGAATVSPFEYAVGCAAFPGGPAKDSCPNGYDRVLEDTECQDIVQEVKWSDGVMVKLDKANGPYKAACDPHFAKGKGCFANDFGGLAFTNCTDNETAPKGYAAHLPVCKVTQYAMGSPAHPGGAAKDTCPDGFTRVMSKATCKAISQKVEMPDGAIVPLKGTTFKAECNTIYTKDNGCFAEAGGNLFYTDCKDSEEIPSGRVHNYPVCQSAPYVVGSSAHPGGAAEDTCPDGYDRVVSATECQAIKQKIKWSDGVDVELDESHGTFAKACDAHFAKNSGCFANVAGGLYFTKCASGKKRPLGTAGNLPVCKPSNKCTKPTAPPLALPLPLPLPLPVPLPLPLPLPPARPLLPGPPVPGWVPGPLVRGPPVAGPLVRSPPVPGPMVAGPPVAGAPVSGPLVKGPLVAGPPVPGRWWPGAPVPGPLVPGPSVAGAPVPGPLVPGPSVAGRPVAVPGPPVAGAPVAGPAVAGPAVPGPAVAGPPVAGPPVAGPLVAGPPVAGPAVAGPPVAGPPVAMPGPQVAGPPVPGPPVPAPIPMVPGPPVPGPPVPGPSMPVPGPPVAGPPVAGPLVAGPPVAGPPVPGPPVAGPLVAGPLVAGPPVPGPPVAGRPVTVPGPPVAGPLVAGPLVAGPPVAGPAMAGPPVAGPLVAGPLVAGPLVAGPLVPGPPVAGPPVAGPRRGAVVPAVLPLPVLPRAVYSPPVLKPGAATAPAKKPAAATVTAAPKKASKAPPPAKAAKAPPPATAGCPAGYTCCGKDDGCSDIVEGDGDCDADIDCAAGLVCGANNCAVGGVFDVTDDCCMVAPTAAPTVTAERAHASERFSTRDTVHFSPTTAVCVALATAVVAAAAMMLTRRHGCGTKKQVYAEDDTYGACNAPA